MELISKIENYYRNSNSVQKIIMINIIVFIFPLIIKTILHLFNIDSIDIVSLFTIESDIKNLSFFITLPVARQTRLKLSQPTAFFT